MKKIKYLLLLMALGVVLTGCGSSSKKMKCTNKIAANGIEYTSEYEVTYDKDEYVLEVSTIETLKSDDSDYLEQTKEATETIYKSSNETYGGYTWSVKVSGDTLTSKGSCDYGKSDMKKYAEDNGLTDFVDSNGKVKLSSVKALYEALGAKCEK